MSLYLSIHPDNPQLRLIDQAVEIIKSGGIVAYPTDSAYALGCDLGAKAAVDRIRALRRLDQNHNFTLVCSDLSELSNYAQVDNWQYRMLKNNTPGPYTFILKGSREVPRRLMHPKRKTIGIRVPKTPIVSALLEQLCGPIMSTTLQLPDHELPMVDAYEIDQVIGNQIDCVIDGGICSTEYTTVVSLMDDVPQVLRVGQGDIAPFDE